MRFVFPLCAALLGTAGCLPFGDGGAWRLNDIQAVGTHNSYKIAIPPEELATIASRSEDSARELDYGHLDLAAQLDLGMRQLEIDVVRDPEGGRYATPLLPRLSGVAYDSRSMDGPGLKVLHVPDIDVRSHCPTLIACLSAVREWSEANPRHAPILIMMNAKEGPPAIEGGVAAPVFDAAAYEALDREIRTVFGPERLIVPDDVRGDRATLRDGALADGWPTLEDARGKVFFALDEGPEKVAVYMRGRESLEGLAMFVNSVSEDAPHAAYFTLNDPDRQFDRIRNAVRQGFVVRTRADAGTHEARAGDLSRFARALESGAQYISTDYPLPRAEFGTYRVRLPGDAPMRANPVRRPGAAAAE